MSPANTSDLEGHTGELETMHKFSEGELDAITRPTVLFSHTNELKILDLANADTNLPENHQDNGSTPPVNTHPSPTHSPLEDTSVASAKTPPLPRIKDRYAALQA